MTAQIPTKVLVAAAAATGVRNQRVAEFITAAGIEAHAATRASRATEEEAAQGA